MVTIRVGAPVDESQRRKDDICREEVIGVREESRARDSPYLPIEPIPVDITAYLVALVGVALDEEELVDESRPRCGMKPRLVAKTHLVVPSNITWIYPNPREELSESHCCVGYQTMPLDSCEPLSILQKERRSRYGELSEAAAISGHKKMSQRQGIARGEES